MMPRSPTDCGSWPSPAAERPKDRVTGIVSDSNSYGIIIVLLHDSFPPLIDEPFGSRGYLP